MDEAAPALALVYVQYRLPFTFDSRNWTWNNPVGHTGTDFGYGPANNPATPVPSVADGIIVAVNYPASPELTALGNQVVIQHADGKFSGYSHLGNSIVRSVGQSVKMGDPIGFIGQSGYAASAYHLHLTMADSAYAARVPTIPTTIDPQVWINSHLAPATSTPLPAQPLWKTLDKETDMLYVISAYDASATPTQRWAITGPGYWKTVMSSPAAGAAATARFGDAIPVVWQDWDDAYKAAVASGFVPAAGQTSRTV